MPEFAQSNIWCKGHSDAITTLSLVGLRLTPGKWTGYFLDERYAGNNARWPLDLFFIVKNATQFSGFGKDDVDCFIVDEGHIMGDSCEFLKVYPTHSVTYLGTINPSGTSITGHWYLTDSSYIKGDFSLSLDQL